MSPTTRALGAGGAWATDAALDAALDYAYCADCGAPLRVGDDCRSCELDRIAPGPEPLTEDAKRRGRETRPGRTRGHDR